MPGNDHPDEYRRDEAKAHQLDRNWAELVQELRVIGTGVQILFAFLLSIAFQARFSQTTDFQKDIYLATLVLSALAAAIFIAPVALHRFLFRFGVKDEIVDITNLLAVLGLAVLSIDMVAAVLLITDWVGGSGAAWACTSVVAAIFIAAWFALPLWLRQHARRGSEPGDVGPA